ncbi:MAG: beta-ketoacyl-[acyl-carrier-protein] synthase family protein [Nitrospirota bacterium]|nr:beta-ketoacyl-[acyl-carrier-protein] synthase family protein [Nitrospirota bacterium]
MQLRRVVITGMGSVSPFGRGVASLMDGLVSGRSAVQYLPELENIKGLRTRVAAKVTRVDPMEIPRKHRRSMSAMSIFAVLAAQEAVAQSVVSAEHLENGRLGISLGSTVGSTQTTEEFFRDFFVDFSLERMKSTVFFHIMNHSCASNVAQALGVTGRILAPAAACATGCQAIGYGFELIAAGKQEMMLCGGADEFHPLTAATFDVINAASTGVGDGPERKSRPFDRNRDGVVCAEGAGIVLLESLDSALDRRAPILAEVVGFATVSDSSSIANPNEVAMERCMRWALNEAAVSAEEIGYVNAHATATEQGDIAESEAIYRIFGDRPPVSSLKGHMGHTMAASGSIELIASVEMMRRGMVIPTLNLDEVDPACSPLRYARSVEEAEVDAFIKNSFALGGVNSSIVVRRYRHD